MTTTLRTNSHAQACSFLNSILEWAKRCEYDDLVKKYDIPDSASHAEVEQAWEKLSREMSKRLELEEQGPDTPGGY